MKKIAILTSGGDAPGMNNAIVSIIKSANLNGIETFVVYDGFKGLYENKIEKISDLQNLKNYVNKGGTFIYSARFPEFTKINIREKAVKNLQEKGIEYLIVLGGDGSYNGALKLHEMGIKVIGLPMTIDNDIASTEYTIGFFTTLQTIIDSIEKIRDTSFSHNRVSVVEVMGRYSGELALNAAIATNAEVLSIPEKNLTVEQIIEQVNVKMQNNREIIVLITEHQYDAEKLAKDIESQTGFETRHTILGHVQRGGNPVGMDRVLATRMGALATKLVFEDKYGLVVGLKNNKVIAINISDALKLPRKDVTNLLNVYNQIK